MFHGFPCAWVVGTGPILSLHVCIVAVACARWLGVVGLLLPVRCHYQSIERELHLLSGLRMNGPQSKANTLVHRILLINIQRVRVDYVVMARRCPGPQKHQWQTVVSGQCLQSTAANRCVRTIFISPARTLSQLQVACSQELFISVECRKMQWSTVSGVPW